SYHTNGKATLADWQATGAGTYDINSVSVRAYFLSTDNGLLYPNTVALNGAATPLASVSTDFAGMIRDFTTPDIGALEFTPVLEDAGITELVSPQAVCPGLVDIVV